MTNMSTGKVRKIDKNYSNRQFLKENLLTKYKSINSLSKVTNINFDSLRRVNVLTTPLATIWQLSKTFGTTVENLLTEKNNLHEFIGLNFQLNSQIFLPFIPQETFFEFILNPIKFVSEQQIFFFTYPELKFIHPNIDKTYICTFLKEKPSNKKLHRIAIIELEKEYIPINGEVVVFKHPKYRSLLFGHCFNCANVPRVATQKGYKKQVFDICDIKILGKILSKIEVNILSTDHFSFTSLIDTEVKSPNKDLLTKSRKDCSRVFFENVMKVLKDRKIPLNQLSRAIGKNVSILRDAKKKQRSIRIETALNISKYLNTSIDSLLEGLEERKVTIETNEKIQEVSTLIPLIDWLDFEREAFLRHKLFSIPKFQEKSKAFAVKNNLEKSFINRFPENAVFIIFPEIKNIKNAKYLMIKEGKNIKIAKLTINKKSLVKDVIIDGEAVDAKTVIKKALGEIVCVFSRLEKP